MKTKKFVKTFEIEAQDYELIKQASLRLAVTPGSFIRMTALTEAREVLNGSRK